jgi:hypothetical protein
MQARYFLAIAIVVLVASVLFVGAAFTPRQTTNSHPDVYVGIYAGSTNASELLVLADKVKSYANLFVVGSTAVTYDLPMLNTICQHLNDNGLNFLTYVHYKEDVPFGQWVANAITNWPSRFLGLYAYDEVGGHQIDHTAYMAAKAADNYTDAAQKYVQNETSWLNQVRDWCNRSLPMFESDYVLYEYNYRAGYDGVFAQFGWNMSNPLVVSLVRGAATMNNKPWGAIITYTYDVPPYMDAGQQTFEDMVYAYQNGAKYILIFDYDKNTTHSMLDQQHIEALQQFWQYIKDHPRTSTPPNEKAAYVLPKDYGFGFRSATDNIWGLWTNDPLSEKVWNDTQNLLQQYGSKLDIIYEDNLGIANDNYGKLVFWNGTETSIATNTEFPIK